MIDHIGLGVSDSEAFVIGPDGHHVEAVCHLSPA
jgi:hypothetical protein